MKAPRMALFSSLLWAIFILACEAVLYSTRQFAHRLVAIAPQITEKFGNPDLTQRENGRELFRYIWTREYTLLQNPEITRLGNRARGFRICAALSGTALFEFYLFSYLSRLA